MMQEKTCRQLWHDYAFLTQEMKKFISLSEWELLEDLERQRELVQVELARRVVDEYRDTAEGVELIRRIVADQEELEFRLGALKRLAEQQRQRSKAYDGAGVMPTRLEREV